MLGNLLPVRPPVAVALGADHARAAPAALGGRHLFPMLAARAAAVRPAARAVGWIALRLVVGALSVAAVLALAQLTVHLLISAYANISPFVPYA
jgi:hypothetical protein